MDSAMAFPMATERVDATLAMVNEQLADSGLTITQEDALMLAKRRTEALAEFERAEFGAPAVVAIAEALATSPYLVQNDVADALAELQDVFYALRDDLPVDVPDAEIVEALRGCFDTYEGNTAEVAAMPAADVMAFSNEYIHATEEEVGGEYRIVDEDGHAYTFDPTEWSYDEQADGWDGERWSDGWSD